MELNRTEIATSKSKMTKLLLASVVFLAAGLWMIITKPETSNPVFNSPFVKGLASYGSTLLGLFGIYFFSRKLFDKSPGLIISEEGVYDNTSIFKFGLIPWSDISHVVESSVPVPMASKQLFITIGLINPGNYIERETNSIKRKLLQANNKNYGSPVHISTNGLKASHSEVIQLLHSYYERYKNSN